MPPRREPQHDLGRAIKAIREEQGLTQEAVALAADVKPAWLSEVESGKANPAWGTVKRIATALGISVSELAARAEDME